MQCCDIKSSWKYYKRNNKGGGLFKEEYGEFFSPPICVFFSMNCQFKFSGNTISLSGRAEEEQWVPRQRGSDKKKPRIELPKTSCINCLTLSQMTTGCCCGVVLSKGFFICRLISFQLLFGNPSSENTWIT